MRGLSDSPLWLELLYFSDSHYRTDQTPNPFKRRLNSSGFQDMTANVGAERQTKAGEARFWLSARRTCYAACSASASNAVGSEGMADQLAMLGCVATTTLRPLRERYAWLCHLRSFCSVNVAYRSWASVCART